MIAAERLGDLGPAAADAIPALTRAAGVLIVGRRSATPKAVGRTASCIKQRLTLLWASARSPRPRLVELLPSNREDFFGQIAGAEVVWPRRGPAVPALANSWPTRTRTFASPWPGFWKQSVQERKRRFPSDRLVPQSQEQERQSRGLRTVAAPATNGGARALIESAKGIKAITETALRCWPRLRTGEHREGGSPLEVLSVLGETGGTVVPQWSMSSRMATDLIDSRSRNTTRFGRYRAQVVPRVNCQPDADVQRAMIEDTRLLPVA